MRKRIVSFLLVIVLIATFLPALPVSVRAAGDEVDEFAASFRDAVEMGLREKTIFTTHPDVNALLIDLFLRYPELHHYYDGCTYLTYPDHKEVTVNFRNLHHPISDIWVADSLDEAGYYLKKGVEEGRAEIYLNLPGSDILGTLDAVFARYPVLYHYYDGCSYIQYDGRGEVTVNLKNLQDPIREIPVVDSDADLFAVIALGLSEVRTDVKFVIGNGYNFSEAVIDEIFSQLQLHYHLAYMGYHGWGTSYVCNENAGVYDYQLTFRYFYDQSPETIRQWRNETESVALYLAGTLFAQDMPDYMKVLRVHDWIINNTRYNIENMDEVGNHVAYGALVKGSCVCMGYAEAAILLLQAAGVETRYVSGDGIGSDGSRESHAWNAVKLGGDWYMLDITWDDPVMSDNSNVLNYNYFNVTSAQLAKDHEWDWASAPQCDGTLYTADYVHRSVQNDTAVYSDYDASTLMTQQKARDHFLALVNQITVALPPEPAQPVQPDTTPVVPEPGPAVDPMPEVQPTVPKPTNPKPVVDPKPSGEEKGGGLWIILVAVVLLGGGGGAAFFIIRKKREEAYVPQSYRQSYGLDNLPKRY